MFLCGARAHSRKQRIINRGSSDDDDDEEVATGIEKGALRGLWNVRGVCVYLAGGGDDRERETEEDEPLDHLPGHLRI